jgi:hypothetical protein
MVESRGRRLPPLRRGAWRETLAGLGRKAVETTGAPTRPPIRECLVEVPSQDIQGGSPINPKDCLDGTISSPRPNPPISVWDQTPLEILSDLIDWNGSKDSPAPKKSL